MKLTTSSLSGLVPLNMIIANPIKAQEASRATKLCDPDRGALTVPFDESQGPAPFETPAFPTCHSQLIQWKIHRWLAVKGVFFGQSGGCGHGTPDAVPGDRDVTYMSVSGRSDLSVRCPRNTYENEWDNLQASAAPDRTLGS